MFQYSKILITKHRQFQVIKQIVYTAITMNDGTNNQKIGECLLNFRMQKIYQQAVYLKCGFIKFCNTFSSEYQRYNKQQFLNSELQIVQDFQINSIHIFITNEKLGFVIKCQLIDYLKSQKDITVCKSEFDKQTLQSSKWHITLLSGQEAA
ncbi:Hypothetical_protein [Hexamita inflata]|uniref:Hypothetical_protein n=1 Tax=Hexamita inflata TaxID=28002 RepID=A0AA86NN02_9EUKA|nr:Hypothetical protein HINF_LOCUS10962 [Hexamita inflata]